MSRLTGLAFFGKDRWSTEVPIDAATDMPDAHHAEGAIAEPHESPWIMIIPLWILAFFAAVAGVLALSGQPRLDLPNWVDPVFGSNLYDDHLSTGASVDAGHRRRGDRRRRGGHRPPPVDGQGRSPRRSSRRSCRRSWYINELYDTVFGRPSERLAAFSATVIDTRSSTARSTGWPPWCAGRAALVRRTQTGYVRNYALGIVLGTVLRPGLHADAAVVELMTHAATFPFLTVLVLVPAIGAAVVALIPTASVAT